MKFQRITPRSMLVLTFLLGGYGLLAVCLILASYLTRGGELAMLVATGAGSISVPVGGLFVLLAASWQHADTVEDAEAAAGDTRGRSDGTPLIDRSIVLIGNGYEHLSMEAATDSLRIDAGNVASSRRLPVNAGERTARSAG